MTYIEDTRVLVGITSVLTEQTPSAVSRFRRDEDANRFIADEAFLVL